MSRVYQWRVCNSLKMTSGVGPCRLVVNYECKQSRGLPIVITICSYLAQTHHNSVHSIQINEVVGKLWCVHLLHLTTFTTSLLLTSSFANAVLTPYMGVAYSPLIYSWCVLYNMCVYVCVCMYVCVSVFVC